MFDYEDKEWLTTKEVADFLRVSVDTVRRWHRKKIIRGTGLTKQHRIYNIKDVRRLLEENRYPELKKAREELKIDDGKT